MIRKKLYILPFLALIHLHISAQYTEIINSNRPGVSISAFSVGKNVIQGETGFFFERQKHANLLTESNFIGVDFAVRYGFLLEQLEVAWEGVFQREQITYKAIFPAFTAYRTNFLNHTIGAKYLIYDPYKNPEEINVYSWKANNSFKWKDLIPAVSLYAGVNLNFSDNPFWPNDTKPSPKVTLATQNHFFGRWVLVTNSTYDRFTTDDPVFAYAITLIHALRNPRWSVFGEHRGIKSKAYADGIFSGGVAHLIHRNFQVDATLGINIKDTPSLWFGNIGLSYRLDYHKH